MRLALFQPDIPQNLGAAIRLGACLGTPIDIIRPAAFPLGNKDVRRAAMDYAQFAEINLHESWAAFLHALEGRRLLLLTTSAATDLYDFSFRSDDVLMVGREGAGVPEEVHRAANWRLRIGIAGGARSLNVVNAAAMALGEAMRQTRIRTGD
ncbi:MAG: tRNA (cytidine(34)-2'-O)-methyltransferase [Minwuia sp.]|uniref:tRNA (cytidine(34)-2'-O)-methyltransferase n=1 Tax=Minwuia sp. TaxID=2493630 RepID=UPI003A83D421